MDLVWYLLIGSCLLPSVRGTIPVPSGCEGYGILINGFHFPNIHIPNIGNLFGRYLFNGGTFNLPNITAMLPLIKTGVLSSINASLPESGEPMKTCRIPNSARSQTDIDFLATMLAKNFSMCYICDNLQDSKGSCNTIGICAMNTVCYTGYNRDHDGSQNASTNDYLHPLAVAHGCCNPSKTHCSSDTYLVTAKANYTIQTCNSPLCNADFSTQKVILNKIQKVDGGWTSWTVWSSCSVSCGHGHQTRRRACSNPSPANGGSNCTGSDQGSTFCTGTTCPVHGGWSVWQHWSAYTATCGQVYRYRIRTCTNPTPSYGGHTCSGTSNMTEHTNLTTCHTAIDGHWSDWGPWSAYSVTCGLAHSNRTRTCNDPAPLYGGENCPGNSVDIHTHNLNNCPVDGHWSSWGHWSSYNGTCGTVMRYRTRTCSRPAPQYGGQNCLGTSNTTSIHYLTACPVDGGWGSWSGYSDCSQTCGGGHRTRNRKCDNPVPSHGGHGCIGNETDTNACSTHLCPRDGGWGSWSSYGSCSVTCGGGQRSRSRLCDSPAPAFGGQTCHDKSTDTEACNIQHCPRDGGWGTWSNYDSCSVTCGGGQRSRTRHCDSPPPAYGGHSCHGDPTETSSCGTQLCPVDGAWGQWSTYGSCSATCGGGQKSRSRVCDSPTPSHGGASCQGNSTAFEVCNSLHCPVDGGWGPWSKFGQCSLSCGSGTMSRSRDCDSPSPHGGRVCAGDSSEIEPCNTTPCIVDGNWSSWNTWAACSVSCGSGTSGRTRSCTNPSPANGGQPCHGPNTDSKHCDSGVCPEWSTWFYGQCSVSCGNGTTMRMRHCSSGHDEDCGMGKAFETTTCQQGQCPIDGKWGQWVAWSDCSVTCAGGTYTRHRSCDSPAPAHNGAQCLGDSSETGVCNTQGCPHWLPYHDVGSCSVSCGEGSMNLERECSTGNRQDCTGSPYDERPCSMPACH